MDFVLGDNGTPNWLSDDKTDGCLSFRDSVHFLSVFVKELKGSVAVMRVMACDEVATSMQLYMKTDAFFVFNTF